ncbi:PCID2 [Bugula neritina]|uniref:PCID2 n=1 Tax=Bugula neritina TaxID=10212 RepID=A0A7J7KKR5_BUGNE|nr:PCID2 [Bugula neritina]
MAHLTFNSYLAQIRESIDEQDGFLVGPLLSFKHPHISNPRLQTKTPEQKCEQILQQPWDEIVAAHVRAIGLWPTTTS